MAHATHFLTRLERLEGQQVELALRLYHDSGLVAHVLHEANLPEGAERVALSLGDEDDGPCVLVTRDGKFVTCLARGMRHDLPTITRHRLDMLSHRIESLRSLVSSGRRDRYAHSRRMIRKILEGGDRISREEFESVARWLPLLGGVVLKAMVHRLERAVRIAYRLAPVKLIGPRYDGLLHDYWRSTWAVAHCALLLGAENGETFERAVVELQRRTAKPPAAMLVPIMLTRLGVVPLAARGVWLASKLPRLVFDDLKANWMHPRFADEHMSTGMSLAAIGLRHAHRHAEVGKLLHRRSAITSEPGLADVSLATRKVLAAYYDASESSEEQLRAQSLRLARIVLRHLVQTRTPEAKPSFEALPDDITTALFMSIPIPLAERRIGVESVMRSLPWIARASAADFYLPEEYIGIRRRPWQRDDGLAMIMPILAPYRVPQQPAARIVTPGRNALCSCGSTTKYKRCCGGPSHTPAKGCPSPAFVGL